MALSELAEVCGKEARFIVSLRGKSRKAFEQIRKREICNLQAIAKIEGKPLYFFTARQIKEGIRADSEERNLQLASYCKN